MNTIAESYRQARIKHIQEGKMGNKMQERLIGKVEERSVAATSELTKFTREFMLAVKDEFKIVLAGRQLIESIRVSPDLWELLLLEWRDDGLEDSHSSWHFTILDLHRRVKIIHSATLNNYDIEVKFIEVVIGDMTDALSEM